MKEKIVLGLSGGRDSLKALKILKDANFEVISLTLVFNNYSQIDKKNIERSKKICEKENIKHYTLDVSDKFKKEVKEYFIEEYKIGRTPSPCIICNQKVKFKYIFQFAKKLGIKYISTGHYADIYYNFKFKRFVLKKSLDEKKDQTYFLYRLSQEILSKTIFPLGKTLKEKYENYSESQEICFVESDYRKFLEKMCLKKIKGDITYRGEVIGKHEGIWNFTIGQRRGIGVALGKPLYVMDINPEKNEVILGDKSDLYKKDFLVKNCNWILYKTPPVEFNCLIKIRSQFVEKMGRVRLSDDKSCYVSFDEPQSAITPGQSAVFYSEFGEVIGGGTMEKTI